MNMQESKHCFSTLNPPNTFRFKGVLQNGAEKGLNPAKSLISSCKVILSGWQLCYSGHTPVVQVPDVCMYVCITATVSICV